LLCIAENGLSNGKRKRKQYENTSESFAVNEDERHGRQSRKREQGQSKKGRKKAKTRKSQFERRNIRLYTRLFATDTDMIT